jgi:phosphinothricin acetyltransferase
MVDRRRRKKADMIDIRDLTEADWPDVQRIYQEGIDARNATFETDIPGWAAWHKSHARSCRLTARLDGRTVGWAALRPVSDRPVYAGVAEVSLYIAADNQGRGVGGALLSSLIERSERENYWTLQAGIFTENRASIALHKKYGFRIVGVRERLGKLDGRWRDVMLLERRSRIAGRP